MRNPIVLSVLSVLSVLLAATSALAEPIESVDPRVYLQTRSHEPNAVRELSTKLDVAIAILAKDADLDALLAPRDAYPEGAKDADVDAMRLVERRALLVGAVHAVAQKKPAGALALLERAAISSRDAMVRADATDQIGALGDDALVALARAANDDDAGVREAAMSGIGKVRTARALAALTPFVQDANDARRQSAAIRAAGAMTSQWAWQARNDMHGHATMRAAVGALLADIERTDANGAALDHVHKVWLR